MNFNFTVTSDGGYTYTPFTDGHVVGFHAVAPNGKVEVVFLDPWKSTENGRATVTVHQGGLTADLSDAPVEHYTELFDVDTTADAIARQDMRTMAIGAEPLPEEIRLRAAEYAESLNGTKDLPPQVVRIREAYGNVDFVNLDRICDWLHLYGVPAYVEQTGGGCATIYAGEQIDRFGDGDLYWQIAMGPGWFEGPAWTNGHAVIGDFYIGPDDQGDTPPVTVPEGMFDLECAWIAIHVLTGTEPFQGDGIDRTVVKAKPVGPAITS